MHFGDVQKEFERINSLLQTGQTKLAAGDYKAASLDFESCLAEMENSYPQDHPDRIVCLKGAGDAYFALHSFDQARHIFKELLAIGDQKAGGSDSINSSDELITRFKLAKSAERAGSAGEAMKLYESLTAMAEKSLGESHPFFSAVLESRAALLSRSGLKKKAKELSEQARRNRNKYSKKDLIATDILSRLNVSGGQALISAGEASIYADSGHSLSGSEKKSRSSYSDGQEGLGSKKLALLASSSLLLLAAVAVVVFFQSKKPPAKAVSKSNIKASNLEIINSLSQGRSSFKKEIYSSLDGAEVLELLNQTDAKLTIGEKQNIKSLKWAYAASVVALMHKNNWLVFRDSGPEWLTDSSGRKLYKEGAIEFKIFKNMRAVATAAEKAYVLDSQYPEDLARLQSAGQSTFEKNPVDAAAPAVNIVYLGHDRSWNPEIGEPAVMAKLCQSVPLSTDDKLTAGAVQAYYLLTGDAQTGLKVKAFFVRACDRQGHLLENGKSGTSLLLSSLNGRQSENFEVPTWAKNSREEFVVVARSQSK